MSAPDPASRARSLWATLVPALAALGLLLVGVRHWRNNGRMKDQLAELAGHNQDQAIQLDRLNEEMRLLTAPDAVHVSLNPQKSPKQPSSTAIFSPSRKRMMFMASNLPPVPTGKAYELWIIPMQGAPMADRSL